MNDKGDEMTEPSKLSHNDEPSLLDSFGQHAFLREVCSQISNCDALKGIGINKAASGGMMAPQLGKIAAMGESWEQTRHQYSLPSQSVRNLLQEAIGQALGRGKKRLVIFIDDLDRCEPQTAFRLLEGIKIYLNLNNCVVLFGMDQRQIEKALSESLKLKRG
ncbi:MAG: P-loop NTPase fold protein [Mariprofundaceae bacterium]|nr:P-loop NTPase fold protein [Mariprofundaceae bacterium]